MVGRVRSLTIDGRIGVPTPSAEHLRMGGCDPQGHCITVNSRYLLKDGRPWLPVMGEFHFSRYPAELWEEELLKMKAAGIDIVATYIFWIHHEEVEGEWDWSGRRCLRGFAELCARNGLYLYPRIGPWAHGECRNGGFPDWLLRKCPVVRADDPTYLGYVERFYGQIYAQLEGLLFKDGGPVIGIQLENEYGHVGGVGHPEHILTLKTLAQRVGFDVPLYTVTGWGGAWVPEGEVLPVLGGYAAAPWTQHTEPLGPLPVYLFQSYANDPNIGGDLAVRNTRRIRFDPHLYPYLTCETGGGIQVTDHRRPLLSADDIAAIPLTQLASGANLIGYYVFHGGTNPVGRLSTLQESRETGYPNDLPVLSYDFQAPLREYGQLRDSYRHLKLLHTFIRTFGEQLAPMETAFPDHLPEGAGDTEVLRLAARISGNRGFLFVNNHQRHVKMPFHHDVAVDVALPGEDVHFPPFTVVPDAKFIWPFNLDLSGVRLVYAEAQPVCTLAVEGAQTYVFAATPGVPPVYAFDSATVAAWSVRHGSVHLDGTSLVIADIQPGVNAFYELTAMDGTQVRILTLSEVEALNLWLGKVGAQEVLVLTEADMYCKGGALVFTARTPTVDFSIYPRKPLRHAGKLLTGTPDGLFTRYTVATPRRSPTVEVAPHPDLPYCWIITLPPDVLAGVDDVFLRFDVDCDKAFLYLGDDLVADYFYNGEVWEVGLKRFADRLGTASLRLVLKPPRAGAKVYFDCPPHFVVGVAGRLNGVEAVPAYRFVVRGT